MNTWDSQYQLHAKPLTQVRLDPDRLNVYADEPELREVNGTAFLLLGGARIMSATLRLDPSSGKVKSDTSALCLVLTDEQGNVYWHRAIGLEGELATVDDAGVIQGGQVETICDVIERFHLGRIDVETNGSGTHVPSILRGALKRRRLQCAVREDAVSSNKNRDILAALQPPLMSGYLWAHTSVLEVVQEALLADSPLSCHYYSAHRDKEHHFTLNPLGLMQRSNTTYLIATAEPFDDIRQFVLHRFRKVSKLEVACNRPEGFSLPGYIAQGAMQFGDCEPIALRAWISDDLARLVRETPIAEDMRLTLDEQGGGEILEATVRNSWELLWWLLSHSGKIRVLAPEALREAVLARLEAGVELNRLASD